MGLGESRYNHIRQIIQDYDKFKADAEELLEQGRNIGDGQPHGTDITDPTGQLAMKREGLMVYVRAVDKGLLEVAPEYRQLLWLWEHDRVPLNELPGAQYVSPKTMYNQKRIWFIAIERELGWKI